MILAAHVWNIASTCLPLQIVRFSKSVNQASHTDLHILQVCHGPWYQQLVALAQRSQCIGSGRGVLKGLKPFSQLIKT